ncbi:hypothetical protein [Paenibacillus sp. FSL K6-2524]|uniref:hypothetical protein n=1 Tax=Paenibacillus sp. FSL K6-2524 TaxID=2954516 RepID=UPI0030F95940
MKNSRIVVTVLIALFLICSVGTSSFAANSNYASSKIDTASRIATYGQAKEIYSKATGELIGYVSIEYTKDIVNGRPQFGVVSASTVYFDYYHGDAVIYGFTGDYVYVRANYNKLGLDVGYREFTFLP